MFDTSRYTIGWVCAILPELVAAQLHLDVKHDATDYEAQLNDDNTYVFGSIGKHNIVIGALPIGEYGMSSAACVARDMVRSLTNIRMGLMVGIGGGAPLIEQGERKKQDIRLGDVVVVGVPGNGKGGVYQYDYGKAIQGKGFVTTGHLQSPPRSILGVVAVLRAHFEIHGNNIDKDVATNLAKISQPLEAFQRPSSASDRLYKASFIQPSDIDDGEASSAACEKDDIFVERPARDAKQDRVHIHYGVIATANTLMKNAITRDALAREMGVLCFEMEAAGLMNQFPFLVVRGICAYSDTHKNKRWQGYAAMTAAAYTRQLLLRFAPNKVEAEGKLSELKEIKEIMQHVSNEIDLVKTRLDHQDLNAVQKEIRNWLNPPDPSKNHIEARKLQLTGTGSWFLDSESYVRWKSKSTHVLWLHGIPGYGKTVMSSTVIQDLQLCSSTNFVVLYFHFDIKDSGKQTLDKMSRSLLCQIYHQSDNSRKHVVHLMSTCRDGEQQPQTHALVTTLQAAIEDAGDVWLILDALDECGTRKELLAWLETSANQRCHLLITSRDEYDIRSSLSKWIRPRDIVPIQATPVDKDIRALVHNRIEGDEDFTHRRKLPEGCAVNESKLME